MRKTVLAALLLFSAFSLQYSAFGQTLSGRVRTVSRPDAASQVLQGVVVRLQGEYNPVMSDEEGTALISRLIMVKQLAYFCSPFDLF